MKANLDRVTIRFDIRDHVTSLRTEDFGIWGEIAESAEWINRKRTFTMWSCLPASGFDFDILESGRRALEQEHRNHTNQQQSKQSTASRRAKTRNQGSVDLLTYRRAKTELRPMSSRGGAQDAASPSLLPFDILLNTNRKQSRPRARFRETSPRLGPRVTTSGYRLDFG